MYIKSNRHSKNRRTLSAPFPPGLVRATVFGIAASGTVSQTAQADDDAILPEVQVESGSSATESHNLHKLDLDLYSAPIQDIPQAIDIIGTEQLQDQSITRLQDALRNVPGITLNSGEGGAHGDNVNLRGLVVQNGFFMDGLRDPGSYTRDSFNLDSVDVIKGSSSMMFGYGSTAGLVNQETKQPTRTTLNTVSLKGGTNDLARLTGDFNEVVNSGTAVRLAIMGERSNIADRDVALNQRFGLAPSISFGMDGPTHLTLSYLHQEENNIPDYGIPFLWGSPAPVARNNFYGLANYDRTQTNTNVVTASLEHVFNSKLKLTNSFRYGNYGFNYQVTAPTLTNDYTSVPALGTPLDQILVYRDQPSSSGATTLLIDRMNLNYSFDTGAFQHDLVTGLGLSRETMTTNRYVDQIDQISPTSLLNPNPQQQASVPQQLASQPGSRGDDINLYAVDTLHVTDKWDVIGGLNFDRFISNFYANTSGDSYTETNSLFSPRAALVYKPFAWQSYYFSYGTSYNPAIQYLTLAPSSTALTPQKTTNLEIGGKLSLWNGRLSLNGALFQIQADNVRVADPDDPTLQAVSFSERVRGLELTLNGQLTPNWDINTGYTHLDAEIVNGVNQDTGLSEAGNKVPNVASDTYNLWTTYTPLDGWKLGTGLYVYGPRFASPDNSASMAGYVLWNMMTSYQVSPHVNLQLNLDNVTNKYYFQSAYYSSSSESHAVPGAGRTGMLTVNFVF
ncbi:MAG: TonB-dependent siderophore receptor [Methylococcales bacterium]|nr:TonB-dependent siderophore receptor [Methylococcales bacterium]